jgi:PHP family Zn ribbon phosphoesterase
MCEKCRMIYAEEVAEANDMKYSNCTGRLKQRDN